MLPFNSRTGSTKTTPVGFMSSNIPPCHIALHFHFMKALHLRVHQQIDIISEPILSSLTNQLKKKRKQNYIWQPQQETWKRSKVRCYVIRTQPRYSKKSQSQRAVPGSVSLSSTDLSTDFQDRRRPSKVWLIILFHQEPIPTTSTPRSRKSMSSQKLLVSIYILLHLAT